MFKPVEKIEDSPAFAERDLRKIRLSRKDILVGISASGTTPYTLAGVRYARKLGARTVAITCNPHAPLRRAARLAIVPVVGPEVVAGSTRMKAGTAQKLILNMLSTATMARLGRVLSGWMISVQLNNEKLRARGRKILAKLTGARPEAVEWALRASAGNLPVAILMLEKHISGRRANRLIRHSASPAALIRSALAGKRPGPRFPSVKMGDGLPKFAARR